MNNCVQQECKLVSDFEDDPDNVTFIFNTVVYPDSPQEYTDADMWAHGFMCGIDLCRKDWQALFDDPDGVKMLRPLICSALTMLRQRKKRSPKRPINAKSLRCRLQKAWPGFIDFGFRTDKQ